MYVEMFFSLNFFFCSALYISLIVDVYEEGGRLLLFFFNRFLIRSSLHGTSPSSWYMAKQLETTVIFVVEIRIWAVCLWKEKKKSSCFSMVKCMWIGFNSLAKVYMSAHTNLLLRPT